SPNETSTAISGARAERLAPRPGASTKKSSSTGSPSAGATSMNPPAPSPVSSGSATNEVSIAASAASTALPPARRISAPAEAVSGWPAATTPLATLNPLEARDVLGNVEVPDHGVLAGAAHARLADRLAERCALGPRRALLAVAGRDHGDPHLVFELLVEHRPEDDVGVGVRGLLHGAGGLVDLPQRQVLAAGDRQQDRVRAFQRRLQQRRGRGRLRGLDRALVAARHADA